MPKGIAGLDTLLANRRSVREFTADPVPPGYLDAMVDAARRGPSPSNSQPVRFVNIQSATMREKLAQAMEAGRQRFLAQLAHRERPGRVKNAISVYWRFSQFMLEAPVLVAVGTVPATTGLSRRLWDARLIAEDVRSPRDHDLTAGLALMAFLLKGEELGLGSCVLTAPLTFMAEPEKVLGLTEFTLSCFVALGFPGALPPDPGKKTVDAIFQTI